jgi:hypothetical protein
VRVIENEPQKLHISIISVPPVSTVANSCIIWIFLTQYANIISLKCSKKLTDRVVNINDFIFREKTTANWFLKIGSEYRTKLITESPQYHKSSEPHTKINLINQCFSRWREHLSLHKVS